MKPLALVLLALLVPGGIGALDAFDGVALDPPPGTYAAPITVTLRAPADAKARYRYLESPTSVTFPWGGPTVFDALPGETRTSTVRLTLELPTGESVTRDYRYVVQRPAVAFPKVTPVPGVFTDAVTPQPVLPEGWSIQSGGLPWSPSALDAAPGSVRRVVLSALGPDDRRVDWAYTIDRRDQGEAQLEVLSPLAGDWANAQALAVSFSGVDRVRWSWGDHWDPAHDQAYAGPVLLDRTGPQVLTVVARSRTEGRWLSKTVRFSAGMLRGPVASWPLAGTQAAGLDIPPVAGLQVSWNEGLSWQPSAARKEPASGTSRKVLAVRTQGPEGASRYLYWLDSRNPAAPEVTFTGGWNPQLVVSGAAEVAYRVTWTLADGKLVDDPTELWGPLAVWKVADQVVAARVTGRPINGSEAKVVTVGFPATGWSQPEWQPWGEGGPSTVGRLPVGGTVPARPGFRAVYRLGDKPDLAEPDAGSPLLEGALLPRLPFGADRTWYLRLAWRDEAGLVGPAGPALALRVDRVPPAAPEVSTLSGQLVIRAPEGEEQGTSLGWAVTADRVVSADGLTFTPYTGPLVPETLRAAAAGTVWLHAQARDPSGNPGPARLNVAVPGPDSPAPLIHSDLDPTVGDTPVEDGGVYPWPQFRLLPVEGLGSLWVGVTDAGPLGADWDRQLQPWTAPLSRTVARGERRTFLVFWNQKTATGWAWPAPKTLKLTLDQGAPAAAVLDGPWPTEPRATAWTLKARPGQPGDHLRYTVTLDGSDPADPAAFGQPWPGTQTWDAPVEGVQRVRVRLAAVSASGLAVEVPGLSTVTIDRRPAGAVVPGLPGVSWTAQPLRVARPSGAGLIRYTLTQDGSAPAIPAATDTLQPATGLLLEGTAGQSVLYRLRWRAFTAAGLPGPATDVYTVIVDRTGAALVDSGLPGEPTDAPPLTGVPPQGISNAAVTLSASGASLLRFELREGIGTPRPVSASSPLWPGSITLDPGAGMDRSYALAIRAFDDSGSPVSPEVSAQVRVDRAAPAAPLVRLETSARRPEASLKALSLEPDVTLHYRWTWTSAPRGSGQSEWRSAGDDWPLFEAPDGALTRLKAEAYLSDEAGNQGPTTEVTALIDQNVVYVAPLSSGAGTRGDPAGSLAEALAHSREEGRTVLFLAAGIYPVDRTLDLGGLAVYGGWDPSTWDQAAPTGRSEFLGTSGWTGDTFVESGDRPWTLEKVDLTTGAAAVRRVVHAQGAVSVKESKWTWAAPEAGWDQTSGSLDLADVSATWSPGPGANLWKLTGLPWNARNLSVGVTGSKDGVVGSLTDVSAVLQNVVVVSRGASGYEGLFSVNRGAFRLDGGRWQGGDGAQRATGLVLKDAEATLWNWELNLYANQANTGIQVAQGSVEVNRSSLSLVRGSEFNQGLVAEASPVTLNTVTVHLYQGAYQGALSLDRSPLQITGLRATLAGGGKKAWGAQFLGPMVVKIDDAQWVLEKKTPGDVWLLEQPWSTGSSAVGSVARGW